MTPMSLSDVNEIVFGFWVGAAEAEGEGAATGDLLGSFFGDAEGVGEALTLEVGDGDGEGEGDAEGVGVGVGLEPPPPPDPPEGGGVGRGLIRIVFVVEIAK
jgi:hypothetical protein